MAIQHREVWGALAPVLEESRLVMARVTALRFYAELCAADACFERALLDHNATVRLEARTRLRQRHPDAPVGRAHELARAALAHESDPARLIGALGVLSDMGTAEDVALVRAFCTHARARVRHEAARTLLSLG